MGRRARIEPVTKWRERERPALGPLHRLVLLWLFVTFFLGCVGISAFFGQRSLLAALGGVLSLVGAAVMIIVLIAYLRRPVESRPVTAGRSD
jgi:hypothetical protein